MGKVPGRGSFPGIVVLAVEDDSVVTMRAGAGAVSRGGVGEVSKRGMKTASQLTSHTPATTPPIAATISTNARRRWRDESLMH